MLNSLAWYPVFLTVVVVVHLPSCVWLFATPWTAAQPGPPVPHHISQSLPKFMFIASMMLSSHLILWCPLLLLPSVFPSIRDFSNESSVHIRWPKILELQLQQAVLPVNIQDLSSLRLTGLISAVQGTLRSLLQHHSLKASILWCSAFFMVQLSLLMNNLWCSDYLSPLLQTVI